MAFNSKYLEKTGACLQDITFKILCYCYHPPVKIDYLSVFLNDNKPPRKVFIARTLKVFPDVHFLLIPFFSKCRTEKTSLSSRKRGCCCSERDSPDMVRSSNIRGRSHF